MTTIRTASILLLAAAAFTGAAGCHATSSADGPGVTASRMQRARKLVSPGMAAPIALGAAQGLLGPPTLVDGDGTRWMAAGDDRCTELRVVTGTGMRVRAVTLFSVTPVSGAQFKACMAAVGQPVPEPPPVEECPPA
jgi:hypothetical protein